MEESIINKSSSVGIKGLEVNIMYHNSENSLILDKIYIYLQNAIIDEKVEHIDKYQVLDDIIISITKIQKENIVYYEWEKIFNR